MLTVAVRGLPDITVQISMEINPLVQNKLVALTNSHRVLDSATKLPAKVTVAARGLTIRNRVQVLTKVLAPQRQDAPSTWLAARSTMTSVLTITTIKPDAIMRTGGASALTILALEIVQAVSGS